MNDISDETLETLVILQEECAEVIVEVSKIFRFGPDQCMAGSDETNLQRLEKELGDLQAMIQLLVEQDVGVTYEGINEGRLSKLEKLKTWSNITVK